MCSTKEERKIEDQEHRACGLLTSKNKDRFSRVRNNVLCFSPKMFFLAKAHVAK
jgi:hypothetical protein